MHLAIAGRDRGREGGDEVLEVERIKKTPEGGAWTSRAAEETARGEIPGAETDTDPSEKENPVDLGGGET